MPLRTPYGGIAHGYQLRFTRSGTHGGLGCVIQKYERRLKCDKGLGNRRAIVGRGGQKTAKVFRFSNYCTVCEKTVPLSPIDQEHECDGALSFWFVCEGIGLILELQPPAVVERALALHCGTANPEGLRRLLVTKGFLDPPP